jgi:hypothetical protein
MYRIKIIAIITTIIHSYSLRSPPTLLKFKHEIIIPTLKRISTVKVKIFKLKRTIQFVALTLLSTISIFSSDQK